MVAGSPDRVPGAPGPGGEQATVWAWGHLPSQGRPGLGMELASVLWDVVQEQPSACGAQAVPHELVQGI